MSAAFDAHVPYFFILGYQQPLFHINTRVMSSAVDSIATEIFLWSGDAFSKLLLIAPDVFTDIGHRVKAQTYAKQLLYTL